MTAGRGRTLLLVTSVLLALVVGVVLATRSSGGDRSAVRPDGTEATPVLPSAASAGVPSVIVPGRPGEVAATLDPRALRDTAAPRYNSLDVWFVRMMIPHHGQALQMAALARDRAGSPGVRALAERIRSSQGAEVGVLQGWLDTRGLPREVAGHDHATMRGMQSASAVRRLAEARGEEFDRLFVRMMSDHHGGAVEMARDLLAVGVDRTLREFADGVVAEQRAEIARMRDLLAP
ncbi:DUF305 domain-containing protein [Micromonospora rosaria]|uniref:DUF305 domain-containing protein n=1 Tax=Micromonospora rosaria TaxID=47874 RepID=A0A136PP34_9ACTN|nr:DUF305 domain-containing protein [Micromonospora rosaria]KXK60280.1 DUF305 domain-containing protein [Micromonospora rosaria]